MSSQSADDAKKKEKDMMYIRLNLARQDPNQRLLQLIQTTAEKYNDLNVLSQVAGLRQRIPSPPSPQQMVNIYLQEAETIDTLSNDKKRRQLIQQARKIGDKCSSQFKAQMKDKIKHIQQAASTPQVIHYKKQKELESAIQALRYYKDNIDKRIQIMAIIQYLSRQLGVDKNKQVEQMLKTSRSPFQKKQSLHTLLSKAEQNIRDPLLCQIYLKSALNIAESLGGLDAKTTKTRVNTIRTTSQNKSTSLPCASEGAGGAGTIEVPTNDIQRLHEILQIYHKTAPDSPQGQVFKRLAKRLGKVVGVDPSELPFAQLRGGGGGGGSR